MHKFSGKHVMYMQHIIRMEIVKANNSMYTWYISFYLSKNKIQWHITLHTLQSV